MSSWVWPVQLPAPQALRGGAGPATLTEETQGITTSDCEGFPLGQMVASENQEGGRGHQEGHGVGVVAEEQPK